MEELEQVLGTILAILIVLGMLIPQPPPAPDIHCWARMDSESAGYIDGYVRVTNADGVPASGARVNFEWKSGSSRFRAESVTDGTGLAQCRVPASVVSRGRTLTLNVTVAANGRKYSRDSAVSMHPSDIAVSQQYSGALTICGSDGHEVPCRLEEMESILTFDIIRWTNVQEVPFWCGGMLVVALTYISDQLLADAVRYVAVRDGKTEESARALYNDVRLKLAERGESAFLLQFVLRKGGAWFCSNPDPSVTLNRSSMLLVNDLMQQSPVVRLTPGIQQGKDGYSFFNGIVGATNSSFTVHLPVTIHSGDDQRRVTKDLVINYDNTHIDFTGLVNTMSQDSLYQLATSTLQGGALGLGDAVNILGLVVGILGLFL